METLVLGLPLGEVAKRFAEQWLGARIEFYQETGIPLESWDFSPEHTLSIVERVIASLAEKRSVRRPGKATLRKLSERVMLESRTLFLRWSVARSTARRQAVAS